MYELTKHRRSLTFRPLRRCFFYPSVEAVQQPFRSSSLKSGSLSDYLSDYPRIMSQVWPFLPPPLLV